MNMPLSQSIDQQTLPSRNAYIVVMLRILADASVASLFTFLATQNDIVLLYVMSGVIWALVAFNFFCLFLIRRGHVELGAALAIAALWPIVLMLSGFVEGFGLILALAVFIVTSLSAVQVLRPTRAGQVIIGSVVVSVLCLLLDQIGPPNRLSAPEAQQYIPFLVTGLLATWGFFIVRQFADYTLRAKLLITFLAVAILPLALLGYVAIRSTQDLLTDTANGQLLASAQQISMRIDSFILDTLDIIQREAQLPLLRELASEMGGNTDQTETDAQVLLAALAQKVDHILSYTLVDTDGNAIISTLPPEGPKANVPRTVYLSPIINGQPYASALEFSISGQASMHFSAPVENDAGEVLAVLVAEYDMGEDGVLQNLLESATGSAGADSFGVVFGRIASNYIHFAHSTAPETLFRSVVPLDPNLVQLGQETGRLPEVAADASLDLPDLQASLSNIDSEPFFTATDVATGNRLNQVAAVKVSQQPAWLVAFFQPRDTFLSITNSQSRGFLLLALAIGGIVAVIGVSVSQFLAQPIAHLTTAATKVSQGDLSVEAAITSRDEIGVLTQTFNQMTLQLRDLVGTLEGRIEARTAQLLAAAEVGRTAASVLDPDELLHQVVNLITNRLGYYYAAVFTLDDVGRYAVLREASGEAGRLLKESGHKLEIGGQSMVGTATLTRQSRIALDVGAEAVRFANPYLPDTRSEIALPLVVGNHVIGALDVQSTQEAAFDEASAAVLQSMADLIAVALNNAEQFQRAELQRIAQNDVILLSRNLFSSTSVEALYRTLATWLGTLVPNDYLSLSLHESSGPTLREYELRADAEPVVVETQRRSVVDTLAGQAFTLSKAVVSTNLTQDGRGMRDVAAWAQAGYRSGLSVPLILGDRVLGTVNFASRDELAYPPRLVAQATQVASQVSAALENVRLNEAQQRNLEELRALAGRLTGEVWQDVFRRTPDSGYQVQFVRNGVRALDQTWLPEIELAVAQRKPVAWSQRTDQSVSSPFYSAMAAPIVLGGEVIGALQVGEANQPRSWTVEDLAFIQAVADQVALAVENARLSEETQRAARRDKAIAEASDHIHRHTELESILRTAIDEVSRITGVQEVSIQLGDWEASGENGFEANDV